MKIALHLQIKNFRSQAISFIKQRLPLQIRPLKYKYQPLTPSKEAYNQTYFDALEEALKNPDVKNIAITGGYGAGKSSFIKTFEHKNQPRWFKWGTKWEFLDISLATFSNPSQGDDQSGEKILPNIEKSILEQIFYCKKPSALPRSHFKRINRMTKIESFGWALSTLLFLCSFCILIENKLMLQILEPLLQVLKPYIFDWALLAYIFLYSTWVLCKIRLTLSSLRLGKVGIKDIELHSNDDASLLNKYLDEILYFFEVTDFNVVVFQDLDRFDKVEIFTRLRELNNLINNSETIKRKIVFLYAIKDEMLKEVDSRVKFFDFLIPIIPYINSNNSFDKLFQSLQTRYSIDNDFLSDISLYISDMRILNNICNEFNIYYNELMAEGSPLEQTKLLAMIIYKNFEPKDFSLLHKCEGVVNTFAKTKRMEQIRLLKTENQLSNDNLSQEFDRFVETEEFKQANINNPNLLRFLLINGYIDENYQNYISYFHEGYISAVEKLFLQNLKERGKEEIWGIKIVNCDAVLKKIHEHEFQREQILNLSLLTHMCETNHEKLSDVIVCIGRNFESNQDFVKDFLDQKKCLELFLRNLSSTYLELWIFLENNYHENLEEYLVPIIDGLDIEDIKKPNNVNNKLAEFIVKLDKVPKLKDTKKFKTVIKELGILFEELQNINPNDEIDRFIIEERCYEYTDTMLNTVVEGLIPESSRQPNFHTLKENKSFLSILVANPAYPDDDGSLLANFIRALKDDIDRYIQKREGDINETEKTIIFVINEVLWNLSHAELIDKLINKWNGILTDLRSVQNNVNTNTVCPYLFKYNKISPSWHNINIYVNYCSHDIDTLIDFINTGDNASKIADSSRENLALGRLISNLFENDNFNSQSAEQIIRCTEEGDIQDIQPQKIDKEKLEILMMSDLKHLVLRLEFFKTIKEKGLHEKFLAEIPEENITDFANFDSNDIYCLLTAKKKTTEFKQKIIEKISHNLINENIAKWIFDNRKKIKIDGASCDTYKSIIEQLSSTERKILFMNEYNQYLTDTVFQELCNILPDPYSKIYSEEEVEPIPYSEYADDFAQNLEERNANIKTEINKKGKGKKEISIIRKSVE